jgi:protoporphyrinogen oxidase
MTDIVIIGSGLAGLSCAYHLKQEEIPFQILERSKRIGGLCKTEVSDGFYFDHSIHILFPQDPHAADLIRNVLLKDNFSIQQRRSFCHTHGVYTEYPYQAHNYGLPKDVIIENLHGLVKAIYTGHHKPPVNFEEWLFQTFGKGIAKNFMVPYNRKVWAWNLKEMNFEWIADRVPKPTFEDVLSGALQEPAKLYGPNRQFWYPKRGGIEALPRGFEAHLNGELSLATTVVGIDPFRKAVTTVDSRGREDVLTYESLVTTIPLPRLLDLLTQPPEGELPAAEDLSYNVVHTVNVGIRGPDMPPYHWIYYPGEDTIFHRISFPHLFSKTMVPEGCQSIMCEISESDYKPRDLEAILETCLADLKKVGILGPGHEILHQSITTLDPAYVIYDMKHRATVDTLHEALKEIDIFPCGRFGDWEYLNMDHSIMSGKRTADEIMARQPI